MSQRKVSNTLTPRRLSPPLSFHILVKLRFAALENSIQNANSAVGHWNPSALTTTGNKPKKPENFCQGPLRRTAPRDHQLPTANRQPPPTANRQPVHVCSWILPGCLRTCARECHMSSLDVQLNPVSRTRTDNSAPCFQWLRGTRHFAASLARHYSGVFDSGGLPLVSRAPPVAHWRRFVCGTGLPTAPTASPSLSTVCPNGTPECQVTGPGDA